MSHPNRVRISRLTLGLLAVLATAPAFAQSTSAAVGGVVTGADGQPVAGAEVIITHTESGTVSRATTDESGRYTARGLRVGGPYNITVTKAGAGTDSEDNVFLQLNQVAQIDAKLDNGVTTLESVQVTGVAVGSEIFSANKMGTGTNVTREAIEALPSANRNIQDYIRLDPRISQVSKADGAISAGGQNTRYNAVRIDGVNTSDPFGLESNNLPTERQPVSMDAIEEINIDLANYDTTISGGTGAVINAVTKSGTNEFHGTAYYTLRDKDWVRENLRGIEFNGFNQEETYGATFGGPIVKDTLFFFANYEKYTRTAPGTSLADGPYGRGVITDANINEVRQIARDVWGFDAGSLSLPGNNKTEIEEYAAKLDWNISENHRAALRYSKLEQSVLRFPLITNSQVSLSSSWYALPKTFESYVGELFSDWSENFSTEFKVAQRDYTAERATFSDLPQIRVNFGNQALFLGTEQNSHVNIVDTKETSVFGAANWYVGDHTIKFGVDYQKNDVLNFFGRNLNGVYEFDSIAAFRAGTPRRYQVRGPRAGGSIDDVPAEYQLENTGLFVQDTWAINYNLNVMFGVRFDIPEFSDQTLYNPRIQELYGYDNTNTVDDGLIQPRVGFNYTFDSDRPTQLRGGIGLFGGAAPNVWIAGSYQNTGLNYVEYDVNNPGAVFTPNVNPPFYPGSPTSARQNVDIVEPGLRLPSVWKANLAFDHELPWWGVVASAELLLTDVNDGLYFQRLDIGTPTAVGPDGRLLYWNAAGRNPANGRISGGNNFGITEGTLGAGARANRPAGIGDVILMRNTNKGKSQQLTLSLEKPLTDTWGWSLGYTYTQASEVSPLTSSQNTSNWNGTLAFQANEEVAYNSRYAIPNRVTGTLNWQHDFFGDNTTRVGLFYEGRTGRPYSYIYFNDANGDSATTNDLFYVPAGRGDVVFTGGAAMEDQFFNWLDRNSDLNAYRGKVAPANAFNAKWVNNFDVRISQELPGFMKGHKAELSFDIMNIGNLLNKDWGLVDDYGFFSTKRVANYVGVCGTTVTTQCPAGSAGKYVYSFTGTTDEAGIQENNNDKGNTGVSRWSVMVGFKYKF